MTLNEDLKGRLDYKYFVMSDWGGTHSPSIRQGLDMEMPGAEFMGATISQMVNNGSLATSYIDDSVLRILTPMFQMGVFDLPNPNKRSANVTSEAHNDLARKLSAASTVLLKNDKNILPINVAAKPTIAVLGLADQTNCITHGDGSGSVSPARVISPLMGISNRLGQSVSYTNGSDIAAAIQLASEASFAIVFVGATSTEGQDRADLNVKANGDDLVFAVAKANPNTIVVVSTPGMILMPWASVVPAILTNMMPGQEVGNAIADILFGDVNPSGRLSFTMPNEENEQNMSQSQWPGLPASNPAVAEYSEGLFFGYVMTSF
jgi:beta-glucosidase